MIGRFNDIPDAPFVPKRVRSSTAKSPEKPAGIRVPAFVEKCAERTGNPFRLKPPASTINRPKWKGTQPAADPETTDPAPRPQRNLKA